MIELLFFVRKERAHLSHLQKKIRNKKQEIPKGKIRLKEKTI